MQCKVNERGAVEEGMERVIWESKKGNKKRESKTESK